MRHVALVLVTTLSLAASYYLGTQYSQKQTALETNLCLTDRSIVNTLENSLDSVSIADVRRYGFKRWERQRDKAIGEIQDFKDAAPCSIDVKIPPDVLKR